jgi:hypothetical protein
VGDVKRHPFDPLSVIVGLALIGLGILVATFGLGELDDEAVAWFAVIALLIGVALIPWRRRQSTADALPDTSST